MAWYNYLLAAVAILCVFLCVSGGLANAAKARNGHLMVFAGLMTCFWAFIAYWNIHGL